VLHLSIKSKLSLSLSLILLVAFFAVNLLNYNVSRTALRQNIRQEALPGISSDIQHAFQQDLIAPIKISSLMANDTFLKDWILDGEKDVSKITKYLWEIKKRYGFFSTFLISSRSRNYYHFNGVLKQISPKDDHDEWYYRFVASGEDYDLDVDTNEAADGALTIFINHRLTDYQGNLLGVTGVGLKMSEVGRMLHSYEKRYGKKVYLVGKKGFIQAHSDLGLVKKANIREKEGIKNVARDILSEKVEPVVREYEAQEGHVILMSRFIPELDRFLVVEHSAGENMQEIRFTFVRNLIIGIAVTVLVIVINVLMVNFFQGRLEEMAVTDELTGLSNRRSFLRQAGRDVANAVRSRLPVSLLMIDIDNFKQINDKWGHSVGDRVLKQTGELLARTLRGGDLAGRLGGEEFAVILPHAGPDDAREAADRLRRLVQSSTLTAGKDSVSVTVSVGAATDSEHHGDLERLMQQADKALYRAKKAGRNRVSTAAELDTEPEA
jgi:diguanylate cyclase (GGDEF)-like protein